MLFYCSNTSTPHTCSHGCCKEIHSLYLTLEWNEFSANVTTGSWLLLTSLGLHPCHCVLWHLIEQHGQPARHTHTHGNQQERILPRLLVDTTEVVWSNVLTQLLSYTSVHSMIGFCDILVSDFFMFSTTKFKVIQWAVYSATGYICLFAWQKMESHTRVSQVTFVLVLFVISLLWLGKA